MAPRHPYLSSECLPSGSVRWRIDCTVSDIRYRVTLPCGPGGDQFQTHYDQVMAAIDAQRAFKAIQCPDVAVHAPNTVGGAVAHFLADQQRKCAVGLVSKTTVSKYQLHLGRLINHRFVGVNYPNGALVSGLPVSLPRSAIVQARDAHLDRPAAAQGLVKSVRSFYRWAISSEEFGLTVNPAQTIDTVYKHTGGHRTWTAKEVRQYLAYHKPGSLARLTMVLVLCSAARRGDLVRMGQQHIQGDWLRWQQEKPPQILVEIPVMDMLRAELEWHKPFGDTFLGLGPNKILRSKNAFGRTFSEWRAESGLPAGLTLHGVRKGLASILTEFGLSSYMIDVVLGHEIGSVATKTYTAGAQRRVLAEQAQIEWNNVTWQ